MARVDKAAVIAESAAFSMLEPALLAQIAAAAAIVPLGDGEDEFLFRAGDAAEGLFMILPAAAGNARQGPALQVSFDDRGAVAPRIGYRLVEGEIVGDLEFLMSGLRPNLPRRIASARALRPLTVLHIGAAAVDKALNASEAFRRRLVRDASRRLADLLAGKAAETVTHPEVRFADGMLGLLDDFGHLAANKGVFPGKVTQRQMADRLGMSLRLFSQRCSDWSSRGLVETTPFSLPDVKRVERLAAFARTPVDDALPAAIAEVEELVARGMLARASRIGADALVVFPGNPVLVYLLALAAARMDARDRAARLLAGPAFRWDGSIAALKERLREAWLASLDTRHAALRMQDEAGQAGLDAFFEARLGALAVDVGALHARLHKDRMAETEPGSAERERAALEAGLLYRQVHEARPNHFCAVNAASLHLVGGRREEAGQLAAEALRLAGRERGGYWAAASRAEALLVLGRGAEAGRALREAVAEEDADLAKTTSTRSQLRLLSGAVDAAAALDLLDPGSPVYFSGPLMTPKDGTPEALEAAEAALREAIAAWLAARRVPVAFSAAACGADIVFAEAALDAGIPLHVILPFSIERFAELSVRIGAGPGIRTDWEERYMACLDRAESVTELWRHEVPRTVLDHHFQRANQHMAGETIMAAHTLRTEPLMLAVLDRRTTASIAGTAGSAGAFAALNRPVAIIDSPFERRKAPSAPAAPSPFAPVVFAFDHAQSDNPRMGALLAGHGFAARVMKDRRMAGQKVLGDWQDTVAAASLLARQAREQGLPVRVVCDYGPVLRRDGGTDADALLRLEGAFDLTAAAAGGVFATAAFVMPELAAGGDPARYAAINVAVEPEEAGGRPVTRGARQIYEVKRLRGA